MRRWLGSYGPALLLAAFVVWFYISIWIQR